jgi:hypothetical protein
VGLATMTSMLIMRTRTFSLVFALSLLMAVVSVLVLAKLQSRITSDRASRRRRPQTIYLLLFLMVIVSVSMWQQERVQLFMERLIQPAQFGIESDANAVYRVDEARLALTSMSWGDHLVGMGFGVQLSDFEIRPTFALHIGIVNLWWRLGVLPFSVVAILLIWSVVHYLQSLIFLRYGSLVEAPRIGKAMTTVICAPGIMALGLMALASGGWAIGPMMSLGMLWGLQRALKSDEGQLLRAHEVGAS